MQKSLLTNLVIGTAGLVLLVVSLAVVTLMFEPVKPVNITDDDVRNSVSLTGSSLSGTSANPDLPTSIGDPTLNLLLVMNQRVNSYAKELFEMYTLCAEGKLTPKKNLTFLPTVEALYGIQIAETGTYANTYIPRTYVPFAHGKFMHNVPYMGYRAQDMTLRSMNYKMISTKPNYNYGIGKIPVNDGMAPIGEGERDHGPFQVIRTQFKVINPSISASADYCRAEEPSLTPYGDTNKPERPSDVIYFPDTLTYMAVQFNKAIKALFTPESVANLSTHQKSIYFAAAYAAYHNQGEGAIEPGAVYGIGYTVSGDAGLRKSLKILSGPSKSEAYVEFYSNYEKGINSIPPNLPPPSYGGDMYGYYAIMMVVASREEKWPNPWYMDDLYFDRIVTYHEAYPGWLKLFQALTKNPKATDADMLSYLKTYCHKLPTHITSKEPLKSLGITSLRGEEYIWHKMDGEFEVTYKGKKYALPRAQIVNNITLRESVSAMSLSTKYYPLMLQHMGIQGIDPKDPATYMTGLGNSPILPNLPSGIGGVGYSGGLQIPAGVKADNSSLWVTHYFKKDNVKGSKVGMAHESGYRDGIPIYIQTESFTFNRQDNADLYLIKRRDKTGKLATFGNPTYLGRNGCGLFTMTSIIHAVGKGDIASTTPKMKEVLEYQNTILTKTGRQTSSKLQPWALAQHNGLYFSDAKRYPLWTSLSGNGNPQSANQFAPILSYLGIPTSARGQSYTKEELRAHLKANKPVIVSQNGTYHWPGYMIADLASGSVTPSAISPSHRLSGGGHIVGFYGLYVLKDLRTGASDEYVKLIDSGTYAKSYSNAHLVKLSTLYSNRPNMWFVNMPLSTQPVVAYSPKAEAKNILPVQTSDVLDMDYTVSPSNKSQIIINLYRKTDIEAATGDYYTYAQDKFTLYRQGVAYTFASLKPLPKIPYTTKPAPYTPAIAVSLDPAVHGSKLVVIGNEFDVNRNIVKAHIFTAEDTSID